MTTTIGIDLGGSKLLAVRVKNTEVVDEARLGMETVPDDLTKAAMEGVRAVWGDDVAGVGVGIAGMVTWPEGTFAWGPHVVSTNVPLRSDLETALEMPVVVDNDANAAAWAEMQLGSARRFRDVLLVTLGTGIGGALVIDGRIHRGKSFAGEFGHMRIDPAGLACDCGKLGCWETVASGPALIRMAKEAIARYPEGPFAQRFTDRPVRGEDVTGLADAGDETARGIVAQVGIGLGHGLCSLIAAFDPEVVVVGGGLGSVGESLLGPARRVAADALHGAAHRMVPPIVVAGLGPRAGAVGAALLAQARLEGQLGMETP